MKKYIIRIVIISFVFIVFIFILDLINITKYISFSIKDDWLGFLGACIGSIIGSIVALFGVSETIKYEKEKDIESNKMKYKPYIYNIDSMADYDHNNAIKFIFSKDSSYANKKLDIQLGIIKNTDNAILIIDYILIDNTNYYPAIGNVIDKNQTIYLNIFLDNDVEFNDIKLYVRDIIGNEYIYKIVYDKEHKKIVQLKEIEK